MFALLFGLSMDYEVFLISRMSEAWVRSRNNRLVILSGHAGTGRVITAAGARDENESRGSPACALRRTQAPRMRLNELGTYLAAGQTHLVEVDGHVPVAIDDEHGGLVRRDRGAV